MWVPPPLKPPSSRSGPIHPPSQGLPPSPGLRRTGRRAGKSACRIQRKSAKAQSRKEFSAFAPPRLRAFALNPASATGGNSCFVPRRPMPLLPCPFSLFNSKHLWERCQRKDADSCNVVIISHLRNLFTQKGTMRWRLELVEKAGDRLNPLNSATLRPKRKP